ASAAFVLRVESIEHGPREQRDQKLVMSCDLITAPTVHGGTLYDVHARPVVALHVEIDRDEVARTSIVQIAGDRERLEKHLRHDHRAAEVEHDAAVVQV